MALQLLFQYIKVTHLDVLKLLRFCNSFNASKQLKTNGVPQLIWFFNYHSHASKLRGIRLIGSINDYHNLVASNLVHESNKRQMRHELSQFVAFIMPVKYHKYQGACNFYSQLTHKANKKYYDCHGLSTFILIHENKINVHLQVSQLSWICSFLIERLHCT